MGLQIERDGDSSITFDDRYLPVLITKWDGKATVALVEAYFRWSDGILGRADLRDAKFVFVTDANAAKQPDAQVRKLISDGSVARSATSHQVISSYVTLESAVLRGVLTMIGWVMDDSAVRAVVVPNVRRALELALQNLQDANIAPPPGLIPDQYQLVADVPVAS